MNFRADRPSDRLTENLSTAESRQFSSQPLRRNIHWNQVPASKMITMHCGQARGHNYVIACFTNADVVNSLCVPMTYDILDIVTVRATETIII